MGNDLLLPGLIELVKDFVNEEVSDGRALSCATAAERTFENLFLIR